MNDRKVMCHKSYKCENMIFIGKKVPDLECISILNINCVISQKTPLVVIVHLCA